MVSKTDIEMTNYGTCEGILVSKHYLYGENSKKVKNHLQLLVDGLTVIKKHNLIKYDPKIIFRLGSIGRGWIEAYYYDSQRILEMKLGNTRVDFLRMLCHELIHSEQHVLGKFEWGKNDVPIWKGKKYKNVDFDFTTEEDLKYYYNVPWEKEAYRRQDELACEVMGILKG